MVAVRVKEDPFLVIVDLEIMVSRNFSVQDFDYSSKDIIVDAGFSDNIRGRKKGFRDVGTVSNV